MLTLLTHSCSSSCSLATPRPRIKLFGFIRDGAAGPFSLPTNRPFRQDLWSYHTYAKNSPGPELMGCREEMVLGAVSISSSNAEIVVAGTQVVNGHVRARFGMLCER